MLYLKKIKNKKQKTKKTLKNTLFVQSLSFSWLGYISLTNQTHVFCHLLLSPFHLPLSPPLLQVDSPGGSLGSPPPRPLWPLLLPPLFRSFPDNCQPLYILGVSQALWFQNGSQQVHKSSSTLCCSPSTPWPLAQHIHTYLRAHTLHPCNPSPFSLDPPLDFEDFSPSLFLPCFSWHINEPLRIPPSSLYCLSVQIVFPVH